MPSTRRIYPEGKLATQVIGTVGTDDQGLTGLEASDNSILGAASGERAVTVDGLGKGDRAQHRLGAPSTART